MPRLISIFKIIISKIFSFIKRRWKITLFVVILIIIGLIWNQRRLAGQVIILNFQHPVHQDLTKTLEASGVVDAKQKALLRFAAGGKITFLGAKEGDYLEKWQTIAIIDQADLQKRLEKDLNLYLKERWDWEQLRDDTKDRALPKREERTVDQSQWDLTNTVIDVEIRDIAIKNTRLSAPFSGVLVSSPVTSSGVEILSTEGFELIDPQTLIFKAAIDEEDIALVQQGQKSEVILDAYLEDPLTTNVEFISFKAIQDSGGTVFVVELPIPAENLGRYRLGLNGDVTIVVDQKQNILTVPVTATKERDNSVYVDVKLSETTTEERKIETGLETDDFIEVTAGLTMSDEILIPE